MKTGTRKLNLVKEVSTIMNFLSKKISECEIEDIKAVIPKELSEYWEVSEEI